VAVIDFELYCSSGDLIFGHLDGEHFIIWKGHFLEYENISKILSEVRLFIQSKLGYDFYILGVGCFNDTFILDIEPEFINIVSDVGVVTETDIKEDIISKSKDVVQVSCHSRFFCRYVKKASLPFGDFHGIMFHFKCCDGNRGKIQWSHMILLNFYTGYSCRHLIVLHINELVLRIEGLTGDCNNSLLYC